MGSQTLSNLVHEEHACAQLISSIACTPRLQENVGPRARAKGE